MGNNSRAFGCPTHSKSCCSPLSLIEQRLKSQQIGPGSDMASKPALSAADAASKLQRHEFPVCPRPMIKTCHGILATVLVQQLDPIWQVSSMANSAYRP